MFITSPRQMLRCMTCKSRATRVTLAVRGSRILRWPLLAAVLLLAGCQATPQARPGTTEPQRKLANGYALLHDLMRDEARVNQVLILKSASDETEALLKDIASAAKAAVARIESFADADPAIDLARTDLPAIDIDVRESVKSATTRELLGARDDFELRMLLSQHEATRSAQHRAKVLADVDENVERSQFLQSLAEQFESLRGRVIERLKTLE